MRSLRGLSALHLESDTRSKDKAEMAVKGKRLDVLMAARAAIARRLGALSPVPAFRTLPTH